MHKHDTDCGYVVNDDLEIASGIWWVVKRPRCFDRSSTSVYWFRGKWCPADSSHSLSAVLCYTFYCIGMFFVTEVFVIISSPVILFRDIYTW